MQRWQPKKGGTRVELGVVGSGKRVRTGVRRQREGEEEDESEEGKTRPTKMVVTALGRGSGLTPVEKRRGLGVTPVTVNHTNRLSRLLRTVRVCAQRCSRDCRLSCLRRLGSWATNRSLHSGASQAESRSLRLLAHVILTPFHSKANHPVVCNTGHLPDRLLLGSGWHLSRTYRSLANIPSAVYYSF